jgi:DNA-binding NtrC family response regulator
MFREAKGQEGRPLFPSEGAALKLLEALPCGILLMDENRRVVAVNDVLRRAFGLPPNGLGGLRAGAAMGCLYARSGEVCGDREACATCEARRAATFALEKGRSRKVRAFFDVEVRGRIQYVELLLHASPVDLGDRRWVLLVVEDLSFLDRLRLAESPQGFHGMVGQDPLMLRLFETIRTVACLPVPVLVQGESGVGKELVAAAIHRESVRSGRHIVPVNCGVLSDGLLESELFGHVRGAFTGAIRDKKGRFELADGGTIFLDEIGELSPAMQVKLLRVLQDGSFERVGSEKTQRVDVRLVCATNRDLEAEVAAGRFRADLFYRLAVVPVTVPPLRKRPGDIPLLARHLLGRIAAEHGRPPVEIHPEALDRLVAHSWPGNVRELENALHFALVHCRSGAIEPRHLPPSVLGRPDLGPSASVVSRRRTLDRSDALQALRQAAGNKVLAARLLGVSRATLYRLLGQDGERRGKS